MGDSFVGIQARLMSQALRKLTGIVSRSNTALVFTNQLREKIGVMFGNPEVTPGGRALKFYSSVRLDIRRIETITTGSEAVGIRCRVKVVKNKVAAPFRVAEFDVMYGSGISREGGLLDVGVASDVVRKSGAWFNYGETRLGQGREQSKEFLRANPDIAAAARGGDPRQGGHHRRPGGGHQGGRVAGRVAGQRGRRDARPVGATAAARQSGARRRRPPRPARDGHRRRTSSWRLRPPSWRFGRARSRRRARRLPPRLPAGARRRRRRAARSSWATSTIVAFARAWVESRDRARPRGSAGPPPGAAAQGHRRGRSCDGRPRRPVRRPALSPAGRGRGCASGLAPEAEHAGRVGGCSQRRATTPASARPIRAVGARRPMPCWRATASPRTSARTLRPVALAERRSTARRRGRLTLSSLRG